MTSKRAIVTVLALWAMVAAFPPELRAEDVSKKWRLSVAIGGMNPTGEVRSNAANQFLVINRQVFETGTGGDILSANFIDPRNDSSAFGALDIKNGPLATLSLQYALTKTFLVEGSVGYQKSDVGDVQVSAQFSGSQPPIQEVAFAFDTFPTPAGELERVPIQLDALWRLRPRAKFNPYFGLGIGYSFIGFEPSAEMNQLSFDMDSSIGSQCRLTSSLVVNATLECGGGGISTPRDLDGARVEARDSFEWNLVAGAEFSIRRKMVLFLDLRWVDASRDISIGFDGNSELGISVPQLVDFDTSAIAQETFGGVQITNGGLVDGGVQWRLPVSDVPIADTGCQDPFSQQCVTYCLTFPSQCFLNFIESPGEGRTLFDFQTGQTYVDTNPGNGDGRNDPGIYYSQGGRISYDGFSLQLGFRYTF